MDLCTISADVYTDVRFGILLLSCNVDICAHRSIGFQNFRYTGGNVLILQVLL